MVYFPDWGGFLYAVRAGNGKLIWSHRISDYNGQASAMSRISPAVYQGELIIGDNVSQAMSTTALTSWPSIVRRETCFGLRK